MYLYKMKSFLSTIALLLCCSASPVNASMHKDVFDSLQGSDPVKDCVSCHQAAVSDWQQSDHAKAMDIATEKSVLGDFNNSTLDHFSQKARFYKEADVFKIDFTEQGKKQSYTVSYVFGHYPLQEYLIKTEQGKMQVFPFAWDSRPSTEGGQKWYPIYPEEDIKSADRLHWQQPLQNWNGMCADCHSDGLKRNYSIDKKMFDTKWDNINVGCQSCHGKMKKDHDKTTNHSTKVALTDADKQKAVGWLLDANKPVATWQGEPRDNQFMETCFSCHALRSPLTNGIEPDTRFLDQFSPSLLTQPLYHSDGQIKDEVYVYGSFLQSKMYNKGVNCLDCHNKHTMKVKTQTNGLCLQCHNANVYQTTEHTIHPLDTDGGQCVNCHMPQTTYMGVDARRDHSFKIPRPDLSDQFNTPNACVNCHTDKDNQWAAKQLKSHFGEPNQIPSSEQYFINLLHNQTLPLEHHLALINDQSISEIKRASAIALLPNSTQYVTDRLIKSWVNSEEPLIRLATGLIGQVLTPEDRLKSFKQLLNDEFKAVRTAAANHFVDVNIDDLTLVQQALTELTLANEVSSWRGEGNLNRGIIYQRQGQAKQAISALEHGIYADPYFEPNYINLADVYRNNNQVKQEGETYNKGLQANPKSGQLHYGYGMYQIRNGAKAASVDSFKTAVKYDPSNIQYAYLYFLAMDNVGNTKTALAELKRVIKQYGYNRQMVELGLSFSQKLNDRASYDFFIPHYQQ